MRLRAEMFAAMGVAESDPGWRSRAADWFAARLDLDDYCFVVVEVDGAVVAGAAGAVRDSAPSPAWPGRDVLINNVCTFPEHRGQGYAQAAFDAVLAWASQTGAGQAELMATAEGRGMYEKSGFRPVAFPAMRAALR